MPPCDLLAITAWEQRYSTQLPEVKILKTSNFNRKWRSLKWRKNGLSFGWLEDQYIILASKN